MYPITKLQAELERLAERGLLRRREAPLGEQVVDVSSNDYLGYGTRAVSRETTAPTGARASRLVTGTTPSHLELENEAADWVGLSDALVFTSGYATNLGVISAIAGPGDVIVSDELNHASIVDGCRLARARVIVVPHRDAGAVERALATTVPAETCWVVTESYFSMDGDSPDLARLRAACDAHGAGLYVDEAHALGVFGPEGGGLCRQVGVRPDVLVGTFGKAVGVQGAFVAADSTVIDYVWNRARSFVYSTALSPLLAELALGNVRLVRRDESARERLMVSCARLREALGQGYSDGVGPVVPIVLGTPERAAAAVALLRARGFHAVAIRPPTVPAGSSRLRISLRADLTDEQLAVLGSALRECLDL